MARSESVADSENKKSPSSESDNPGAGKDVLFGWLVGRAAADLGLAQALAASEAQRAEQFKRLEESLLAQIHEVQKQQTVSANFDDRGPELQELRAHLHGFSERLSGLESATQQATQIGELAKSEMAMLQSRLVDRENLLESRDSRFEKLEGSISTRIQEMESVIDRRSQGFDAANHELQKIEQEVSAMADRIARAELAAQQAQMQAAEDFKSAQERVASLVMSESAALKAELLDWVKNHQSTESIVRAVEETFQKRLDDRHRQLEQKFFARVDAEVQGLQTRVQNLTEQVESVTLPTTMAGEFDAERSRWSREVDDRITARIQELGDEIRDKLQTIGSVKVESEHFVAETRALAHRIAQNEQAMQQTAAGLSRELSAIKAGLNQQQNQQQTTEALIKNLEETVRIKIQEIQNYLVQAQNNLQNRDAQFNEQRIDLQRLAQRIAEVESLAHQTHALMVNENEQAAQLRDGFRMDLATIQGQLSEKQSIDAVIQGVEDSLTVKLRELQNQLAQKMLVVDRRDAEFRELKAQVQILALGMTLAGTTPPLSQASAANQIKENAVFPVDTNALSAKSEDRPSAISSKTENTPHATQELLHDGAEPRDSLLGGAKNSLTQLQQQMSADIERARAELREKSGRWKVRR
jgi:DNA repair exonuclease SbcCD ATPase subunit